MNFRVTDGDSDSDDSAFPPESGLSQQNAPHTRRLVIDDPSSSEDESSQYTTAREEDETELNVALENLSLSSSSSSSSLSQQQPIPAPPDDNIATDKRNIVNLDDSPSTVSVIEKLRAGGVPHVIRASSVNRDSGISSLEEHHDDDESVVENHIETLTKSEALLEDEDKSEALVDSFSVEEEEEDDDDDSKSTVVQEGRTKTPKRQPVALVDTNETEFESPPVSDTSTKYNSEVLLDAGSDDTSRVLQDLKPKREWSFSNKSEALLSADPDDASTVLQDLKPKRESSFSNNSEALLSVDPDDASTVLQVETPKRKPSMSYNSEALVDTSPDDTSTTMQVETPRREPSLSYNSEALVDTSPDDTSTVVEDKTPKREPSLNYNSEALVDSSPDGTSTVMQVETPRRDEQSLNYNSEALVDSSPDDTSTTMQVETPRREPSLSYNSEALVDMSTDDTSTVYPAETPGYGPSARKTQSDSERRSLDDDTSFGPRAETVERGLTFTTINCESFMDTSSEEEEDSVTVYPAETPTSDVGKTPDTLDDMSIDERKDTVDGGDRIVIGGPTNRGHDLQAVQASQSMGSPASNNSRVFFDDDNPNHEETISEWNDYDSESPPTKHSGMDERSEKSTYADRTHDDCASVAKGNALVESDMEQDESTPVAQEDRKGTTRDPLLVDTSSEEDSIVVDCKDPSRGSDASSALVDTSVEEDDTSTVVQEGRTKTPKRTSLTDVNDYDSLSDQGDEGRTDVIFDTYEDSAWAVDPKTNEVFLSDDKFEAPDNMLWPKLRLPMDLFQRLYSHQKAGVQWMAGLHTMRIGGCLGDDMGMGKTYQALAFLGGLMRSQTIRNALVVAPLSVLQAWEKEARVVIKRSCVPKITIIVLSSDFPRPRRQRMLQTALSCSAKSPHLVITTYGLIQSSTLDFVPSETGDYWNYVCCDEVHSIKNPSAKVSKACERICRNTLTRRLGLTGTLIQNNLKELWAVVNWATSGKVFGTLPRFTTQYSRPIEEGRHKNAEPSTIKIAEMANNDLQLKLRPHYLQRMKADFLQDELPEKKELVVWTHLSKKQRSMYKMYLKGDKVADVLSGENKSPLEAVTWLKKLCGHPLLVEITGDYNREEHVDPRTTTELLQESTKLQVLVSLLNRLTKSGHRALIFSQSTRCLDILESVLSGFNLSRIDGSTKGKDRQHLVEAFNSETSNIDAMLLSTKAAGLGLTLTGADRAIVYDPSWNPAEDAQAIDRCYRIGQQKQVTVFRFVAAGTVEEAMLAKQVHKDGIRRAVTTSVGNATERFFEKNDLRKLFELGPIGSCEMLEKLQTDHRDLLGDTGKPSFLNSHKGVVGVSSYDTIYLATQKKDPNGDDVGTPFGGAATSATKTPRLIGRSQKVLAKPRQIEFVQKENRTDNVARANPAGSTPDSAIDVDTTESSSSVLSKAQIETLLGTSESLRAQGNIVGAVSILMELAKKKGVKGEQKLRMHQGLAKLGDSLGWLPQTESQSG